MNQKPEFSYLVTCAGEFTIIWDRFNSVQSTRSLAEIKRLREQGQRISDVGHTGRCDWVEGVIQDDKTLL